MNKKLTWFEFLTLNIYYNNEEDAKNGLINWAQTINNCEQAEKEGKVCLNPPDEAELCGLSAQGYCTKRNELKVVDPDLCEDIGKAISKRLRNEE